jgi:hypothetical protein
MLVRIKRLAWKDLPWLYCVGAVLFFFSWLGEKQLEQEFTRKREELERLQRHISSNHNIAQLWFRHMLLLDTQEPKHPQAIAFASSWYMEFTVNALQSAVAWGDEDITERKKFAETRQSELQSAKAAFRDGQYPKVALMAAHLRTVELEWASRLASANSRHVNEIEARGNVWGWLVRVFYVIGAGLIGFAFIRSRLRATDSSELTTYIEPPHEGRG